MFNMTIDYQQVIIDQALQVNFGICIVQYDLIRIVCRDYTRMNGSTHMTAETAPPPSIMD